MNMNENLKEELASLNEQMNEVIDEMIAHYGKFITLNDASKDHYAADLIRSYNALQEHKDYIENMVRA